MKRKILKKMLSFGFVDKTARFRMIRFPYSKINIGLYVTGRRPDGFHNIESLFYPVPFREILEVVEAPLRGRNSVHLNLSGLPLEGDAASNLVVRAYDLLASDFDLPAVDVYLHKVIPGGSGLGGGSSDGASMILMMNEFAGLRLDQADLEGYAARLGSDCPFFIRSEPARVTGRGEVLEAAAISLSGMYMMLFRPDEGISTAEAYRHVKMEGPPFPLGDLIGAREPHRLAELSNAFEPFARERVPLIGRMLDQLRKGEAICAFLTGSGSAVFALYSHPAEPPAGLSQYLLWSGCL